MADTHRQAPIDRARSRRSWGPGAIRRSRRQTRGRGAKSIMSGPLRAFQPVAVRRRLAGARRPAAAQDRGVRGNAARRSSPATTRPTFPSTARSIPIAAASMAAPIATRGPPTPIWACRRDSISKRKLFAKTNAAELLRARTSAPGYQRRAPSRSAPTPIPTSRSSAATASRGRSWRCWPSSAIRSASSPSRRW